MLHKSVTDKIQENVSKPIFSKSPPLGKDWKSKCMRIIPEEFIRSTPGAFEHRVVCSVRWGNSWQFWLHREKKGLVILQQDWDEFVDTNCLGPDDILIFEHEETMYLQVRFFKKNGEEIISAPLEPEPEPEPEPVHTKPQYFHQAFASPLASVSGGTEGRVRLGSADVKNPERYLLNPKNPYFVKTLTKRNTVLYVPKPTIKKYGLKFGAVNSAISYILPGGKEDGLTKLYSDNPGFAGWGVLCKKHNLKVGDSIVCELELSEGVVAAVRLHFPQ